MSVSFLIVITTLVNQVTEATTVETDYFEMDYDDFDQRKLEKFFDDEYDEDHDMGRVFYSHSMMIYDSTKEKAQKEQVRNAFSDFGIVSPKFYEGKNEKMQGDMNRLFVGNREKNVAEMEFYKMIVDDEFLPQKTHVDGLSYGETVKIYEDN